MNSAIKFAFILLIFSQSAFANPETIILKPLTCGPHFMGMNAESDAQINLWGRGEKMSSWSKKKYKTYGVAQIRLKGSRKVKIIRFPMKAEHDYIGTKLLRNLEPGKQYSVKLGYFTEEEKPVVDSDDDNDFPPVKTIRKYDFTNCSRGKFVTNAPNKDQLSFLFASCRLYTKLGPCTLFGSGEKADQVFGDMLDDIDTKEKAGIPTSMYLELGDFVYYDHLSYIFRNKKLNDMRGLYKDVKNFTYLKKLMASRLFYGIGDDHDMHTNDSNFAVRNAEPQVFQNGIQAYQEHIHHDGPKRPTNKFWYNFTQGPADFFVLDSRSERDERTVDEHNAPRTPTIISDTQFKDFENWITDKKRANKIVFIVAPVSIASEILADGWSGFPAQQAKVLRLIAAHKNAFILTGDAHATRYSIYNLFEADGTEIGDVTEIMSSGLKSVTFATDQDFPDVIDQTKKGGLRIVKKGSSAVFPYQTALKAQKGWLAKRIGDYVKGVYSRITVDTSKQKLFLEIHDLNSNSATGNPDNSAAFAEFDLDLNPGLNKNTPEDDPDDV